MEEDWLNFAIISQTVKCIFFLSLHLLITDNTHYCMTETLGHNVPHALEGIPG